MISSENEYQKAREEIEHLNRWLTRLETEKGTKFKGLTASSIRKMISRIQEELAKYEAANLSTQPALEDKPESNDDVERRSKDGN
ncbi:MAG: hypothetical protein ABSG67_01490 [Thermoguttaceae bacterium]|jgi:molybdenum-dependent DNA-binding transcriptional regulator ModE